MNDQLNKVAEASAKLWNAFEEMTEAMEILGTDFHPLVDEIAEYRRYAFRAYDAAENTLAALRSNN